MNMGSGSLLGLAIIAIGAADVFASMDYPEPWGVDGTIVATARAGNTLYVGGAFRAVGPTTGGGVPLDPDSAEPVPAYPRVAGAVYSVQADGTGGWFIGGLFEAVGQQPRSNLAHILADGSVASWAPNPDGEVRAILVKGNTVFLGGAFLHVGGQSRRYLAAVDAFSGAVEDLDPQPDGPVRALLLDSGRLFVGGDFVSIGRQSRFSIAEVNPADGIVSAWNPNVSYYGNPASVRAIAMRGDTLFVGGSFWSVGGSQRQHLAAISAASGTAFDWRPSVTGPRDMYYGEPDVQALAIWGSTLLVGGRFTSISGQVRAGLAALDMDTAVPTSWNPEAGPWIGVYAGTVSCLLVRGHSLYVGGGFQTLGGQPRVSMGEVDLETGAATDWNPRVIDEYVQSIAADDDAVYAGGSFQGLGSQWKSRKGLAAIDLTTGQLKDWNPEPNGLIVYSLAVAHGTVYAGGHFSGIGGQERWGLAALDTLSGLATNWNPTANEIVASLEVVGDTLYAAGYFTAMSGQPRGRLASFDLATGELTSWNPDSNNDVFGIAVHGQEMFLGGSFSQVGGRPAKCLAAVDRVTGAVRDWNPAPDEWVSDVCVIGDKLFACGAFTAIGAQARSGIAGFDAETGQLADWSADINSIRVECLASIGDTLFVGGNFSLIGGQERRGLAALDANSGAVFPWDPELGSETKLSVPVVWSLSTSGSQLYAGGRFLRQGTRPVNGLAAFDFSPTPPAPEPSPIPRVLAMAPLWPNPAQGSTTIRFALPGEGPVTLALFDVHGRRVSTILDRVTRTAGTHDVPIQTSALAPGFYFCRLDAGDDSATRKLVVFR